ncbi:MAG: pyridoxine 5'-phosphate synthase [Chitinophagales bacterium]
MSDTKARLSVNINKVAWLRNARGGNLPNLTQVALDCERFGAEGITVHPRPDERHIKYQDVYDLKPLVTTEFNIEGYPNERFMQLVKEIKPEQCTLVPDPPGAITSNAGWDTVKHRDFLKKIIASLQGEGIRVSLFAEPEKHIMDGALEVGAERVEFYTGPYAERYHEDRVKAVAPYAEAAAHALELGLGINAGHDLNLDNLRFFRQNVAGLLEVSIGHALISDALYYGLENTIQMYLKQLKEDV